MLLPGDWVEVRPSREIVQTLDGDQSLNGLPFMPEMLAFCGKRFQVRQRAERTCTYHPEGRLRRLDDSVVLNGLRCDGSLHGGCELGCMFYWKTDWLETTNSASAVEVSSDPTSGAALRATRDAHPDAYFCQATELPAATTAGDSLWSPAQYLRFLRVRTFTPVELVVMFSTPVVRRIGRSLHSLRPRRSAAARPAEAPLRLRSGEWVEVKSKQEILRTLDENRAHKGLSFGGEMYGQCGKKMRVLKRVETIMDEKTGKIRRVHDTVLLEGSFCDKYLGCARGMPFMWREAWLKRAS